MSSATDPTNIPGPDAPQGPGDEITTPEAHNHGGEPKVWCETCQHTHIASIPEVTYACHRCGFGSWHSETATEHESLCHGHETYPLGHVMRPVTPAPDHGAAGFCTDHGQAAARPTTVAAAVEAGARAAFEASNRGAKWATLMVGARRPFSVERQAADTHTIIAAAVLEAVGYAALLAEVERLRGSADAWWTEYDKALTEVERLWAGIAHIVDRYGNAPGIETCATMYDLRRLVLVDAACDRGPCHLPRGHEGRCNPGKDALPRERYDAVLDSGPTDSDEGADCG